jgi:hypothetical protein
MAVFSDEVAELDAFADISEAMFVPMTVMRSLHLAWQSPPPPKRKAEPPSRLTTGLRRA